MRNACNGKSRGFTLIGFALVVLVSAALSAMLLHRLEFYREQAEIAAMRQVVGAMRTALQVRAVQLATEGRRHELQALAADNPMNWLVRKPGNYLGEFDLSAREKANLAGWVFDPRDRSLTYLPQNTESFSFGTARLLKFKVEFAGSPFPYSNNGAGKASSSLALNEVSGQGSR
jgi:type II secretory pathway pseudopilin PulG